MTWQILALIAAAIFIVFQFRRLRMLHGCALRVAEQLVDHRIALRYIAQGNAFPQDDHFARSFLNGDTYAMRRFGHFATFRALELERQEEDDAG